MVNIDNVEHFHVPDHGIKRYKYQWPYRYEIDLILSQDQKISKTEP